MSISRRVAPVRRQPKQTIMRTSAGSEWRNSSRLRLWPKLLLVQTSPLCNCFRGKKSLVFGFFICFLSFGRCPGHTFVTGVFETGLTISGRRKPVSLSLNNSWRMPVGIVWSCVTGKMTLEWNDSVQKHRMNGSNRFIGLKAFRFMSNVYTARQW